MFSCKLTRTMSTWTSLRYLSQHCRAVYRLQVTPTCCYSFREHEPRHVTLHTSARLNADENQQRKVNTAWSKFAAKIRMFTAGVKALYSDVKLANEYRVKYGKLIICKHAPNVLDGTQTDILYSRKQLQFVHKTLHDMKQMLPTVVLFFIPFIGYIAPFLAFAYPEKLLSQHFWTPSLRAELQQSAQEAQRTSFVSLMDTFRREVNFEKEQVFSFIPAMIAQFAGEEVSMDSESAAHELSKLPIDHMGRLMQCWGVRSLIPTQASRQQLLHRHLEYLFVCDWLVQVEGGVGSLSHEELVANCMERGLYFDPKASEEESAREMRGKLESWIRVSTQHRVCPTLVLAHLPLSQYWTPDSPHKHSDHSSHK